ncbi:formyltetrahydrofolate-dependent phosphoribosylglycinamide formyltransferase [Rarobacter incanus]|uniref:Phosphoribosylglycinamide formyltransferase n=1 Tax=Rarobacter incanus TaxID=153494 RepID=A0A542SR93_9MICO|nr:formyltetrahydrofolate-dependent phosphoribosylglycinamide formyltransferase [Rarobacter incanus]
MLASGAGSTMAAVLRAQTRPAYGARIVAVISDVAGAGALVLAKQHGIATAVVSPAEFESRDAWNVALARTVQGFAPDIVLSAGFMRILGAPFLAQFGGRTVNTHPALLPSFPGAHAVRDAMTYGVKVTGCTLHVVDSGVDTGPIIAQVPVPVLDGDDQSTLHERIKEAERELLVGWMPRLARGFEVIQGRVHLPPFRGDTIE